MCLIRYRVCIGSNVIYAVTNNNLHNLSFDLEAEISRYLLDGS